MANKIITTETLQYFKQKQDTLNDTKIKNVESKIPKLLYAGNSDIDTLFTTTSTNPSK